MNDGLARLNAWAPDEARAQLMRCCGSSRWAEAMAGRRPFQDLAALQVAADEVWGAMGAGDWLEAFGHHPRIGERRSEQLGAASTAVWSAREQAGIGAADEQTRLRLDEGNRRYEERFGHVFLICATGKSAAEMLDALERRLANDPETELRTAAEQQGLITRLRLEKLVRS